MKTHIVKYPGSIKKVLMTMDEMKQYRAYSIISKAGLPEGTLFYRVGVDDDGEGHTIFTILLPTGEAFSGFALKRHGDTNDYEAAACIAAGRAVAVWKNQKLLPDKEQEIWDALQKQQVEAVDFAEKLLLEKSKLREMKKSLPKQLFEDNVEDIRVYVEEFSTKIIITTTRRKR